MKYIIVVPARAILMLLIIIMASTAAVLWAIGDTIWNFRLEIWRKILNIDDFNQAFGDIGGESKKYANPIDWILQRNPIAEKSGILSPWVYKDHVK